MPLVLDGTNGVSGVDGTASNPAIEGTDSNTGIFYPAADTVAIGTGGTEALRVNSSQNVGIGTTSPTAKLQATGSTDGGDVIRADANSSNGLIILRPDGVNGNQFRYGGNGANANILRFVQGGDTERMRLDASGRLMVGYSSNNTGELFGVLGLSLFGSAGGATITSSYANAVAIRGSGTAGTTCSSIHFGDNASGTSRQWAIANAPSTLGRLDFVISSAVNTNPLASGTTILSLTSTGLVSVPTYSTTVGATNRDLFVDNAGVIGYVSSLQASKTNIQDLTDTSWLHQLNPVSFNYRKKDEEGNYTDETDGDIQYGMIAEDVEQVRPDLCFYDEVDGEQELRGIQYSKLVPVMLKEIQKLRAELNALKGNA